MLLLICVCLYFQHRLYRGNSTEYRPLASEVDGGVEAGSDMAPPTPAFPISPPTPYGRISIQYIIIGVFACILSTRLFILLFFLVKNMAELSQFRQTPSPSQQSCGGYATDHGR